MRILRQPGLHWALGIALGAVFLYASLDKIAKPAEFARIVYHYQILGPSRVLPPLLANAFSATLPWVEALTGIFLIAGLWRREAALLSSLMLLMFVGAVGWALAHGIDIENCGCFSVSGEGRSAGLLLLAQDLGLLAGAIVLVAQRPSQAEPVSASEPAAAAR